VVYKRGRQHHCPITAVRHQQQQEQWSGGVPPKCQACRGRHYAAQSCYIQPLRRRVPDAEAPEERVPEEAPDMNALFDGQPAGGLSDSSEASWQEEEELAGPVVGGRNAVALDDDDDVPAVSMLDRRALQARREQQQHDERDEATDGIGGLFGNRIGATDRRRRGPREAGKIDPAHLRYFFWDSECSMREDGGAAVGLDGQPLADQPVAEEGVGGAQRQFHDPLLVIGELLCVPCMRAGFGSTKK
jgi:hypothetical protein